MAHHPVIPSTKPTTHTTFSRTQHTPHYNNAQSSPHRYTGTSAQHPRQIPVFVPAHSPRHKDTRHTSLNTTTQSTESLKTQSPTPKNIYQARHTTHIDLTHTSSTKFDALQIKAPKHSNLPPKSTCNDHFQAPPQTHSPYAHTLTHTQSCPCHTTIWNKSFIPTSTHSYLTHIHITQNTHMRYTHNTLHTLSHSLSLATCSKIPTT